MGRALTRFQAGNQAATTATAAPGNAGDLPSVWCVMRRLSWGLFVSVLFSVFGCDHATKHLARRELLPNGPKTLIPGWLDLRYTANTDTAFSLLGDWLGPETRFAVILTTQALVTLGMIAVTLFRRRVSGHLERMASAVVLGGALGNLLDRLISGHVVDFIHVSFWPVFNVADIAICIGAGLLLIAARNREFGMGAPR